MAPQSKGWDILGRKWTVETDVLEVGKMGKCRNLSDFDKRQIVMARPLGQSISKTTRLVGCSQYAVVILVFM